MESIKAVVDVVASDIVTMLKQQRLQTWVGASAPYIQEVSVRNWLKMNENIAIQWKPMPDITDIEREGQEREHLF